MYIKWIYLWKTVCIAFVRREPRWRCRSTKSLLTIHSHSRGLGWKHNSQKRIAYVVWYVLATRLANKIERIKNSFHSADHKILYIEMVWDVYLGWHYYEVKMFRKNHSTTYFLQMFSVFDRFISEHQDNNLIYYAYIFPQTFWGKFVTSHSRLVILIDRRYR